MSNFDYGVLKSFVPIKDIQNFIVFESTRLTYNGNTIRMIVLSPFPEIIYINLSDYNSRLTQKIREEKLNTILNI